MNKMLEVSILAFDNKNIDIFNRDIDRMQQAGVQYIHYDVMDGRFVPNVGFGPEHLQEFYLRGLKSNVHLMVMDAKKFIKKFLTYPCNAITFHIEPVSTFKAKRLLKKIKRAGVKAGIAIKPSTNIDKYQKVIELCDIVTMLGVEPGFGGQQYIASVVDKQLKKLHQLKKDLNHNFIIQLDGGVNYEVIEQTKEYVNSYVSGSFITKQRNPKHFVDFIKKI